MKNELTAYFDSDLTRQDVQALSSADAVAAFFAQLGYNTDARTAQTAGNLGITAESTARPIKKIELIADQERGGNWGLPSEFAGDRTGELKV